VSGLAVGASVRASVKVGRHPAPVYRYKIGQKKLHLNKKRCKKYIQKSLENRNPKTKNLLNQQVFKLRTTARLLGSATLGDRARIRKVEPNRARACRRWKVQY
jgi:hypothetical protein